MYAWHQMTVRIFFVLFLGLCARGVSAVLPIEQWTTQAGTRVYFVAARALPMLDIRIDVDAGARFDPTNKQGLAALTATLLAAGVTAKDAQLTLSEGEIADGFANVGAQYFVYTDADHSSVHLRCLSAPAQRDSALALLKRVLHHPDFPEDKVQRDIQISVAALRENLTRADTVADRALLPAIYGTHPYGQLPSIESIGHITRQDVSRFYRERYGANRAVITLVGDIDQTQARALAERLSQSLPSFASEINLPAVSALSGKGATLRFTHPSEQAYIMIGQPGITHHDPDYFALLVGNHILGGGGFTSRLVEEVREKRGLSYSVHSFFSPWLQSGVFEISLQTRKDQADQTLQVVRQTLTTFVEQGPTAKELQAAKDYLINSFPLRIDSNAKLLANVANFAWHGLPLNYLDTWSTHIAQVSLAQVKAALARHLQPQAMVTVVVGSAQ